MTKKDKEYYKEILTKRIDHVHTHHSLINATAGETVGQLVLALIKLEQVETED